MSEWRELHGDQNQRMAAKMLEQQGEINRLKAALAAAVPAGWESVAALQEAYTRTDQWLADAQAENKQLRAKLNHPVVAAVVALAEEAERQYKRAEAAHDAKDEANRRWIAAGADGDAARAELAQAREVIAAVRAVADEIAGGPEMRSLIADKIRAALSPAAAAVPGPNTTTGDEPPLCVCGHPQAVHLERWADGLVIAHGARCQLCFGCNIYRAIALDEARASVALDGETFTVDAPVSGVVAGPDQTHKPGDGGEA